MTDPAGRGASGPPPPVAPLWLAVLQQVIDRAAHDVKNALHGLSVNLEVVRSRLARVVDGRGDPSPPETARSAELAVEGFERVMAQVVALLALSRPTPPPVNVSEVLSQLALLLDRDGNRAGGSNNEAEGGAEGAPGDSGDGVLGAGALAAAPTDAVRLALAAALLAQGTDRRLVCRVDVADQVTVRVSSGGGTALPPDDVVAALAAAGVRVVGDGEATVITLPRAL